MFLSSHFPCFGSAADLLVAGVAFDDADLDLEDDSADPDEMTYEVNSCTACLLLIQARRCLCLRGICVAAAAVNTLALAACGHTAALHLSSRKCLQLLLYEA